MSLQSILKTSTTCVIIYLCVCLLRNRTGNTQKVIKIINLSKYHDHELAVQVKH